MKQRQLGRTGLTVGEIGIGCEGLIGKTAAELGAWLDVMEAAGANCIDLYHPGPELRSALGEALRGRRESFVLQGHICSTWEILNRLLGPSAQNAPANCIGGLFWGESGYS